MTRAAASSFTVQEQRAFGLERWSLSVQLAVAVIAAVISFQALRDARPAEGSGLGRAPRLPLAIDGFAVIASLGIIRSQGAGERFGERASKWLGLCFVLGLSIAGNVAHALDKMDPDFPRIFAGLFGSAPPIIVAYGSHSYGRAMTSGVSKHVLVDDPDKIHFRLRTRVIAEPYSGRQQGLAATSNASARPSPTNLSSCPISGRPGRRGSRSTRHACRRAVLALGGPRNDNAHSKRGRSSSPGNLSMPRRSSGLRRSGKTCRLGATAVGPRKWLRQGAQAAFRSNTRLR